MCRGSPITTAASEANASVHTEDYSQPSSIDGGSNDGASNERPHASPQLLPNTFSRKDLKPMRWDRLVIHPDSKLKSYYETLIVLCVLYTAVIEPFEITYMTDIVSFPSEKNPLRTRRSLLKALALRKPHDHSRVF